MEIIENTPCILPTISLNMTSLSLKKFTFHTTHKIGYDFLDGLGSLTRTHNSVIRVSKLVPGKIIDG